jgi:hypothetical protein
MPYFNRIQRRGSVTPSVADAPDRFDSRTILAELAAQFFDVNIHRAGSHQGANSPLHQFGSVKHAARFCKKHGQNVELRPSHYELLLADLDLKPLGHE